MMTSKKCSTIFMSKIVLVSVLLQVSLSLDISNDDNHQGLVHLARIERPGYWTFVEDKSQPSGIMPSSRLGRKAFKLPQTLIPYPRTGRMLLDSEIFDYDELLMPDSALYSLGDSTLSDIFLDLKPSSPKRGSIAFPPRIGRKKRSISEEDQIDHDRQENEKNTLERSTNQDWSELQEFEPDFFFRADRRPNSRSRNAFVPRVGKKRAEEGMDDMINDKRALAFTPRIGRASLISRFGRNDPKFQVQGRGFIPRIGRRASFIPRIGRDVGHHLDNKE